MLHFIITIFGYVALLMLQEYLQIKFEGHPVNTICKGLGNSVKAVKFNCSIQHSTQVIEMLQSYNKCINEN